LLDFPQQCFAALQIAKNTKLLFEKKDFNKIVFVGVGGSGIGGDIVKACLYSESPIPVMVLRQTILPAYVDSSSLVFISSYSGNTEETLNIYRQAKAKGATVIALSSGGRLKELAAQDSVTLLAMPPNMVPRCTIGYLSLAPLCVLSKLGLIKETGPYINSLIRDLEDLRDNSLGPHLGPKENGAKRVAKELSGKLPVVYSASPYFEVCSSRLRCQLNENAKVLALSNVMPELMHNEIEGWRNSAKISKQAVAVLLRDKDLDKRLDKGMDLVKGLIAEEGCGVIEVWSRGENLLNKIFSLIYTGDFISYYLAVLSGIDPAPIEKTVYLKQNLSGI